MLKIINKLDEKKSIRRKISTKLLKLAQKEIIAPHAYYLNHCIRNEIFPEELKQADITPTFKSGDPKLRSNYRPISLLPLFSKIFEKIIKIQLTDYFETILSNKLCGFREKTFNPTRPFPTCKNSKLVG